MFVQWTQPQFRCPPCEDTLIIYDPWWGPPPDLHIPMLVFFYYFYPFNGNNYRICSSNLSDFSASPTLNNFGPNLTLIFIPGSMGCPEPARASQVNNKQFSVEVSQEEPSPASSSANQDHGFDCGKSVESSHA